MSQPVRLETIENFRDFGGYAAAGDRRIARGRLYRSANHSLASDEDLERLRTLNLATIVDLRRPSERERRPSRRWRDFSGRVIEGDHEYESAIAWEDFIRTSDHSAESFRWYLTEYYKSAPLAPRHVDLFSRYFHALSEAEGPILVHCAGGKDRTGMICALTHALVGVHEDDIMSDFLATNSHVRMERIGPMWARDIAEEVGRAPPLENLVVAMSVEPGYLHAAFAAIRAQFGDLEDYMADALGVDAGRRAAIEQRILV
jgi:protein-tyrosine phosphatase